MPSINYKDTSLATRYLQAFLQNEEDSTLRASGIYDEYTHDALITYMELPEVLSVNKVYSNLILKYPKIPDYFKVERTPTTILLTCRVINDVMIEYVNTLRVDIYEYVKMMGWSVTKFVSFEDDSDIIQIEFTKESRKNLIPKSAITMINQNVDRYVVNTGFRQNGKVEPVVPRALPGETTPKNRSECLCILPCLPDHTYVIFVDAPTDTTGIWATPNFSIAESSTVSDGIFDEGTALRNIQTVSILPETDEFHPSLCMVKRTVLSSSHSVLINTFFNTQQPDYPNIWMLDITDYHETDFEKYTDVSLETGYSVFREKWAIHSKFFDYLYGMAISKYSSDMNIAYLQDLLMQLYPGTIKASTGVWLSQMTFIIRDYQKKNGILFSIGYVDTETESLMLKDIADQKFYEVGGE